MMIFGVYNLFPTMNEIYTNNALAWLGTSVKVIKYEDIISHLKDIESLKTKTFFEDLLGTADINLPRDWKDRILVGSDREQSGTARENLDMRGPQVPDVLPDTQKKLVDIACPGFRDILGYR